MDDGNNHLPILNVTISGPTLSSLLNHLTSSSATATGLLFGDISLLTPTALSDDTPSSSPPPPSSLVATVTGFTAISPSTTIPHRRSVIGWFSARRLAPLRPSLLDHSLSLSLSSSQPQPVPFIFLLLTTPSQQTLIHTHEYRAYHFRPNSLSFETVSLEVVNIGPGFRGQYGHFSPKSGLPWMPCVSHVGSPMREDDSSKSLSEMKRAGNDQKDLEAYVAGGYDVGSLTRLTGSDAVGYMGGVEELYEKMLAKLQGLARIVEASSARVLELENHNTKLRRRVAGVE